VCVCARMRVRVRMHLRVGVFVNVLRSVLGADDTKMEVCEREGASVCVYVCVCPSACL